MCVLSSTVGAQGTDRPPGYWEAEAAFYRLSSSERYEAQMLLEVSGYWNAVSNEQFSGRLFDAVNRFKIDNTLSRNGILSSTDMQRLRDLAVPLLRTWRLRPLIHRRYPATLWVPAGLGLELGEAQKGYQIEDQAKSIRIYFNFLDGADLSGTFRDTTAAREQNGFTIDYKVIKSNFFAVHASKAEAITYIRYHAVEGGLIGFSVFVDANRPGLGADRLITLMSDLFRADVQLGEARRPPEPPEGAIIVAWQDPSFGFGQGPIGSMPSAPSPPSAPLARQSEPTPSVQHPSVVVTLPAAPADVEQKAAALPLAKPGSDPAPSVRPPSAVVTLPATPADVEHKAAALPPVKPAPDPQKPSPSPPWQPDGRVVALLLQLHYLRSDEPSPSRERLNEAIHEFAQERGMTPPPAKEMLLAALRRAVQSETSLTSCRTVDAERGAICQR